MTYGFARDTDCCHDSEPHTGRRNCGDPGIRPTASIRSVEATLDAVRTLGHQATPVFLDRDADLVLRQADIGVALLASGTTPGTKDGALQGFLETQGIPYTGSGVLACALANNKVKAKAIWQLNNLPTVAGYTVTAEESRKRPSARFRAFGFPVLVRPVSAPHVVPSNVAMDELELEHAIEKALHFDDEVLVDRAPSGRFLEVALLDGAVLGYREHNLAPWFPGHDTSKTLPPFTTMRYRALVQLAQRAGEALDAEGPAVVTLTAGPENNESLVSLDPLPMLGPDDRFAQIASRAGIPYPDLLKEILAGAKLKSARHTLGQREIGANQGPTVWADDDNLVGTQAGPVAH